MGLTLSLRSDNDQYAHMNNSTAYNLIDSIINTYLIKRCGLDPPNSSQLGLVVSSHAQYFASVSFPTTLDLGLCVVKLGSSSVQYEVAVFDHDHVVPAIVGGYTHVFVDSKTRKSQPMAETLREGLQRIAVDLPKL
jgi:acyl-CoA thioester hydrolase